MSLHRLLLVVVAAVSIEIGVFCFEYQDLVFLTHMSASDTTPGNAATARRLQTALARRTLTRRHLETIIETAGRVGDAPLQILALERLARDYPLDPSAKLRLADALRTAGRADEASRVYREVLGANAAAPTGGGVK